MKWPFQPDACKNTAREVEMQPQESTVSRRGHTQLEPGTAARAGETQMAGCLVPFAVFVNVSQYVSFSLHPEAGRTIVRRTTAAS